MLDKYITLGELKCPSKQLDCILRDLFCEYTCEKQTFDVSLNEATNVLMFNFSGKLVPVDLSRYLDDVKVTSFVSENDSKLVLTMTDGTKFEVDLTNIVKSLETLTSVTKPDINSIEYTNEDLAKTKLKLVEELLFTIEDSKLVITVNGVKSSALDIYNLITQFETVTEIINTVPGHEIGSYMNEKGTGFIIKETITSLIKKNINELTFNDETGIPNDLILIDSVAIDITGNQLKVVVNGKESATIDLAAKIDELETVTSITKFQVENGNLVIGFYDENKATLEKTVPLADICAFCSNCVEVGSTSLYTTANLPATGTPGQIIFVTDALATDGSTGSPMMWQVSTNKWVKLLIS